MIKRIIVIFVMICFILNQPQPTKRIKVEYEYTVDGDTVCLSETEEKSIYRLLYIDTPEYTKEIEAYGKEATDLTKELLENASTIEIEYQVDNEIEDKYKRKLVWLFVDGKLLQEELAKAGFVEDVYDNGGNYYYKRQIQKAILEAKLSKKGIYRSNR